MDGNHSNDFLRLLCKDRYVLRTERSKDAPNCIDPPQLRGNYQTPAHTTLGKDAGG